MAAAYYSFIHLFIIKISIMSTGHVPGTELVARDS